jgi:hypothetical protein
MRAVLLLFALATPSWAACPNESEIFSCTIRGKPLQLCHWKGALIYNYGPVNRPELSIAEPLETVAFTPWAGIGRTMVDIVAFENEGVTYEVWTAMEKQLDETEPEPRLQGGVTVLKGHDVLASLECDPGTPSIGLDVISGLKEDIGQCWDHGTQTWGACP